MRASVVAEESACNAGGPDSGVWWAVVREVAKHRPQLSDSAHIPRTVQQLIVSQFFQPFSCVAEECIHKRKNKPYFSRILNFSFESNLPTCNFYIEYGWEKVRIKLIVNTL